MVKPGDMLAKDQAVLEIETDKATIEVPSSVAGRVADIKVKVGDKVKVGQAILSVEDRGAGAPAGDKAPGKPQPQAAAAPKAEPAVGANTAAKVPDGGLEQHVEGATQVTAPDKAGTTEPADAAEDPEEAPAPAP